MAIDDVFHLVWRCYEDGYRWINGVLSGVEFRDEDQFLVRADGSGMAGSCLYYPLEDNTLFRRFATTELTPEGILGFANKFGQLLSKDSEFTEIETGKENHGEQISLWMSEIDAMRTVITIWDMINDSNLNSLRNYFSWTGEYALAARDLTRLSLITVAPVEQNLILLFGQANVKVTSNTPPRIIHVDSVESQQSKDERLVVAALAYIEYVINNRGQDRFDIKMINQDGRLQFMLKPDSLLGVLWLQCAQAISQRKEFRQCKQCSSWFEPYSEKTKKTFCGTACRLKYYRGRISKAQKLHEQGKSPESIAKILGAEINTVRGWLSKGGTKK